MPHSLQSQIASIHGQIVQYLRQKKLTLAVAESCTGGLLSSILTSVSGASDYFLGGVVCYSDFSKQKLLVIDPKLIQKHTSISPEITMQLAKNTHDLFKSDIAIAITGLADPSSTHPKVKAGTVFIAVAHKDQLILRDFYFKNSSRDDVRYQACFEAMQLLEQILHLKNRKVNQGEIS